MIKFKVKNNVTEFLKFHVIGIKMNVKIKKRVYQILVNQLKICMVILWLVFKYKDLDKCVLLLIIHVNHLLKFKIQIIVLIILIKMLVYYKLFHNVIGIKM